jgi:UDP-N-acetylglucosamine--N-acetylmuramyl-(pentapeptide) pyrophosphoryl-undecaprenol N-acetylglucosamine transferase
MRTLLIMAGGTGGHIFPGLAVAEQARAAGWQVVWMGARGGMEERLVPRHGYRAAWIRARAARGKGLLQKLLLPANLLFSFWESARHIRRIRPDVVLGLGGYVAFPGGMMASLLGRPLALHEQNAVPGLANRVLAGVSDKVMVAFPGTLPRAEWTGNPVRAEITAIAPPEERFRGREGPIRLLVVGGSLGAQALNEAVPQALALLGERPIVVHQSGERHLESLRGHYAAARVQGELLAFIDDMARRYA